MQPPVSLLRLASRAAFLAVLAVAGWADVVVLKDGRRLEGTVVRDDDQKVVLRTGLGELEFARSEVKSIQRGKTPRQEFAEREKAARTADEFHALGEWAKGKKLPSLAKKAWRRACVLDPDHAGANTALGRVRYGGEWMTPEERDARVRAEEEAAMAARGLVRHGDAWVTPEDKRRAEQGLVEVDGRWVTPEEAKRLAGLEYFGGEWIPRVEAVARRHAAEVARRAQTQLQVVVTEDSLVAGPFPEPWLVGLGTSLDKGRTWFDGAFGVEPGLELYGGGLAEFYVWNRDSAPYERTTDLFASLTTTVPEAWADAVKRMFGLYWIDPYPMSSARAAHRPLPDLAGHCLHHQGHLMLGRLGYDGRLLPPWYEESLAAIVEFHVFEKNAVFCRARGEATAGEGTGATAGSARFAYDSELIRDGKWIELLLRAIEAEALEPFERLAQKQFSDLELLHVAQGMAILTWMGREPAPGGGSALGAFHAQLRLSAPPSPLRVVQSSQERSARYDAAFRAATGRGVREADTEWRRWLRSR